METHKSRALTCSGIAAVMLAAAAGLAAQQGQAPAVDPTQGPTFRTGAEAVTVDVDGTPFVVQLANVQRARVVPRFD